MIVLFPPHDVYRTTLHYEGTDLIATSSVAGEGCGVCVKVCTSPAGIVGSR